MKRFFFALLTVMGISAAAMAAGPEISVSYGGYNQMDACDNHDGWHGVNNSWGSLNLGVNFPVTRNFTVGPSYTFSSTTTKGKHHSNIAYHAIMLNGYYTYFRNSIVDLYGHLGAGAVISHLQPHGDDAYNKGYFAMQLSPLGAKVDINRTFAIFGELGFGAQGLLQVGFKINL